VAFLFKKHYTRDEAQALLPQVRQWLDNLEKQRHVVQQCERRIADQLRAGYDLGGETVNRQARAVSHLQEIVAEFEKREIQLKDLDRGLVDFPAIIGGKEVLLCWEKDEETIEYWHDLDTGYAGRERL
jgi:hypothetical protein